jgi:hypothetical protein
MLEAKLPPTSRSISDSTSGPLVFVGIAGVAVAGLLGVLVTVDWKIGLAACALVAIVLLGILCATPAGVRFILSALVASTFVTRFKFQALGLHFRPEDGLVLAALVALMLCHKPPGRLSNSAARMPIVILCLYVAWTLAISLIMSPKPAASLSVTGWLALDVAILVVLITGFKSASALEEVGVKWACVAFACADVLYFIGNRIGFGIQIDTVTHSKSAYGLSYEANLLASTAAIWLFLAISSPKVRTHWTYKLLLPVGFFALIASFTRAADAALIAGLGVWGLLEGYRARQMLFRRLGILLVAASLLLIAVPSLGSPVAKKLGQLTNVDGTTGKVRVTTSSEALKDMADFNWVLGLGANSFGQRHLDYTRPDQDVSGYLGVLPLELVYDGGIVAILLLLYAFFTLRPFRLASPARALGLLVVYVVASLATSPFWLGSTWVIVALGVLAARRRETVPVAVPVREAYSALGNPAVSTRATVAAGVR